MNLRHGWPGLAELAPVYAVIVAFVYPWSLYRFFWRVPSMLYYSTGGEIATVWAYMTTVNLLESLVVLAGPLAMSLLLPRVWFRDRFVSRGVSLVAFGLAFLWYLSMQLQPYAPVPWDLYRAAPLAAVAILWGVFTVDRIPFLRRALEGIASRLMVFLYLFMPLSVIAGLTVLIRNLA